jgi:hypothetical protein
MKKSIFVILIFNLILFCSCASNQPSKNKFVVTDEFVDYIKSRTNPYEWGLHDDGRFYPYSPPGGRMIGYRQVVTDEKYYSQGWPKEEAEKQLRKDLEKNVEQLRSHLNKKYPKHPFDTLSNKSQQILLDFAHSEGVENLEAEFFQTVIDQDWQKFYDSDMYLRWKEKSWPDIIVNRAFANRWISPETRKGPWIRQKQD